jgi:hypothetical protein
VPSIATNPVPLHDRGPRLVFCLVAVFLFTLSPVFGHAKDGKHAPDYTTIVVFGDLLSDTGNVADLTKAIARSARSQ